MFGEEIIKSLTRISYSLIEENLKMEYFEFRTFMIPMMVKFLRIFGNVFECLSLGVRKVVWRRNYQKVDSYSLIEEKFKDGIFRFL